MRRVAQGAAVYGCVGRCVGQCVRKCCASCLNRGVCCKHSCAPGSQSVVGLRCLLRPLGARLKAVAYLFISHDLCETPTCLRETKRERYDATVNDATQPPRPMWTAGSHSPYTQDDLCVSNGQLGRGLVSHTEEHACQCRRQYRRRTALFRSPLRLATGLASTPVCAPTPCVRRCVRCTAFLLRGRNAAWCP